MASLSPSNSSTKSSNSDTDVSPPTTPRTRITFPSLAFARSSATNRISTIPLKSPPSPPAITPFPTTDASTFSTLPTRPSPPLSSLSPTSSPFSGSSTLFSTNSPYAHCAYPSWPRSDILSPPSSSFASLSSSILSADSYNFPTTAAASSSYITDEDLLDLENLPLYNNIRIAPEFLVAATPLASVSGVERERRRPRSKRVVLPADVQNASVPISQVTDQEDTSMLRNRRRSSPLKRRKLKLGLSPVVEMLE